MRRLHTLSRTLVAATALAVAGCLSGGDGSPSSESGRTSTATSSSTTTATTPSSPRPTTLSSTDTTTSACVRQVRGGMSPTQRAGQLIMGAVTPGSSDAVVTHVVERGLGGAFYLGGWEGARSVSSTSRRLQQAAPTVEGTTVGLLVAADQEGGQVQQLTGTGFTQMPSAVEQSRVPNLRSSARTWGTELRDAGVNVNLGPVADTVPATIGRDNAPIGALDRQYGSTPRSVASGASAFTRGMLDAQVQPVVKHFPGIGRIRANTDFSSTGTSDRTMTREDPHLRPFAASIRAGARMVMVGTASYPRIDGTTPAVFSKEIVTGMLREDLGFDQVVVSDDVGVAESVAATPVGRRATQFVAAGGDVMLTAQPSQIPTMVEALTTKAAEDPGFARDVDASVTRVLTLKEEMGLLGCG